MSLRVPGRPQLAATIALATVFGAATGAYALDSDLDVTFDGPGGTGNGKFSLPITAGPTNDNASDVAIQSDGKIVAAGTTYPDPDGLDGLFALARYGGAG